MVLSGDPTSNKGQARANKPPRPRTQGRACVFCGGRPVTAEHVLPRWMETALPGGVPSHGGLVAFTKDGTGPANRSHLNAGQFRLRVKCVCGPCNNGWMSDMQMAAAPIITQMMNGQYNGLITAPDQTRLASWSMMTAMMALTAMPSINMLLDSQYSGFFETRLPPAGTSVAMAIMAGGVGTYIHQIARRVTRIYNDVQATRDEINANVTTIVVHDVAFQVISWRGYDGTGSDLSLPFNPATQPGWPVQSIWPITPLLIWPLDQPIPLTLQPEFIGGERPGGIRR